MTTNTEVKPEKDSNEKIENIREVFNDIIKSNKKPEKNQNFRVIESLKKEILQMIGAGYNLSHIFNMLKDAKVFMGSYTTFVSHIKRIKKENIKKPLPKGKKHKLEANNNVTTTTDSAFATVGKTNI